MGSCAGACADELVSKNVCFCAVPVHKGFVQGALADELVPVGCSRAEPVRLVCGSVCCWAPRAHKGFVQCAHADELVSVRCSPAEPVRKEYLYETALERHTYKYMFRSEDTNIIYNYCV